MVYEEISLPLRSGQILGLDISGNLTANMGELARPLAIVAYRDGVAHLIVKSAPMSMEVRESGPIVITLPEPE